MNYYETRHIKVHKIPILLKMRRWKMLAQFLLYFVMEQEADDNETKCWRNLLAQIVLKIALKEEKHGEKQDKVLTIKLLPSEKFALEHLIITETSQDTYITNICQEAFNQMHLFDINLRNLSLAKKYKE